MFRFRVVGRKCRVDSVATVVKVLIIISLTSCAKAQREHGFREDGRLISLNYFAYVWVPICVKRKKWYVQL